MHNINCTMGVTPPTIVHLSMQKGWSEVHLARDIWRGGDKRVILKSTQLARRLCYFFLPTRIVGYSQLEGLMRKHPQGDAHAIIKMTWCLQSNYWPRSLMQSQAKPRLIAELQGDHVATKSNILKGNTPSNPQRWIDFKMTNMGGIDVPAAIC